MKEYTVFLSPGASREIKSAPARFRGRLRKAIDELAEDPRPSKSKALAHDELRCEPRRLRLESWRIIYAVIDEDMTVDVLAVRKRPPYKYEDLAKLLEEYSRTKEGSDDGNRSKP
jgi:mRNA interferase RelE/StbE